MLTTRKNQFIRFFAFTLALLIFNMSVDPPDILVNMDADIELEEDLSVNEMESITEIVLEKGFDIDNAIPENDDPDSDNLIKKVEVFQTKTICIYFDLEFPEIIDVTIHPYTNLLFSNIFIEAFSPPPEA